VKPAGVKTTLTWSSSKPKVATVSASGLVKAIKQGETVITVTTDNGVKASCTVTVKAAGVVINKANFPDARFRKCVRSLFDANGDGTLSSGEIKAAKEMRISKKGIKNLKGIEFLKNLQLLYVDTNKLTKLDVSKNTKLLYLSCAGNKLTKLNLKKNTRLKVLSCGNNKLTKLDVSKNTQLESLFCYKNALKSLNISKNKKIESLWCEKNKLTRLNLGVAKKLKTLYCYENKLKSIDIGGCTLLKKTVRKTTCYVSEDGKKVYWPHWEYGALKIDRSTRLMDGRKVLYKN